MEKFDTTRQATGKTAGQDIHIIQPETPLPMRQINSNAKQAKARILVLHGHGQSGSHMQVKTRFLTSALEKAYPGSGADQVFPDGFEFYYPNAPNPLRPADLPRDADSSKINDNSTDTWAWGIGSTVTGNVGQIGGSIKYLLHVLETEGPFVGIIAFSTGATMAMTLLSLAERGASAELTKELELNGVPLPPRFQFAICFSGCILTHPQYRSFYYPKIQTPVLHFIGDVDTFLPRSAMLTFSERCENGTTEFHPGAHFVARYKESQKTMLDFVAQQMSRLSNEALRVCNDEIPKTQLQIEVPPMKKCRPAIPQKPVLLRAHKPYHSIQQPAPEDILMSQPPLESVVVHTRTDSQEIPKPLLVSSGLVSTFWQVNRTYSRTRNLGNSDEIKPYLSKLSYPSRFIPPKPDFLKVAVLTM